MYVDRKKKKRKNEKGMEGCDMRKVDESTEIELRGNVGLGG